MSVNFRLPKITANTDAGKLQQVQSYLYQLVDQLNWALQTVDTDVRNAAQIQSSGASGGTKSDPVSTFNDIKALIIKSADIVNAYYEEINKRLAGVYVAESDFGVYKEETEQLIKANSAGIEQLFTNIQQIISDIEGLDAVIETSAYIKSGLLYYADDGAAVYGLEVGQTDTKDGVKTFHKFARFTAGKLSFYDANDIEVAYISDYQLIITEAWIKGNLRIGPGFEFDTSNGLALIPV